jgi:hypothetical protein
MSEIREGSTLVEGARSEGGTFAFAAAEITLDPADTFIIVQSLGIIGEMYFDIKPAGSGGQNILGDLMSSLFGGGGGSGAGGASGSGNQKAIKGKGKPRGRIAPKIGAESLD